MTASRLILLALLLLLPLPALGAPPLLRPYAGQGVLIIPESDKSGGAVTVYQYPGVRQKESLLLAELPSLSPAISPKRGEIILATVALREGFARVAVSPSGETQWFELRENWRAIPWERFLTGRTMRLMAGQRESSSRLKQVPAESGGVAGLTSAGAPLVASEVRDDWAMVRDEKNASGWLRWRDGDGRLLVTVE